VETTVEIQAKPDPKRTIQILGFTDDGASMNLKMNWITPSHLEVLFKGDTSLLLLPGGEDVGCRDFPPQSL
jgi:hypothetical protein